MTAEKLLEGLRGRGVSLAKNGDRLKVRGPSELLTPELLAVLRARKPELLRLLAIPEPVQGAREPVLLDPDAPRYLCGGCWRRLPEVELREVGERLGRGFRCGECLLAAGEGRSDP